MVESDLKDRIVQILKWDRRKDSQVEILLRVTSNCNLKCMYCFARQEFGMPLSDIILKALVDKLKEIGFRRDSNVSINITGGEPLIRRDLFDILQGFKKLFKRHYVNIQTNATLINKPIAEKLYKNNIRSAFVGVPAINKKDYYILTHIKNGFDLMIAGVRDLISSNINVCLNFVLNRVNLKSFIEIPDFVLNTFGDSVSVNLSTLSPGTPEMFLKEYGVNYLEAGKIFQKVYQKLVEKGIKYGAFGGDCSPPICAFSDKRITRIFSFEGSKHIIKYVLDFNSIEDGVRYKCNGCKECVYNNKCNGVSSIYARVFGDKNFQPVRQKLKIQK